MKKYYSNIDYLKGILIIFVIAGHVIQGEMDKTLIRHIIYYFHMPLFIGVSGYLFNMKQLNKDFILGIKKLIIHLIIPWGATVGLYTILLNYKELINGNLKIIIFDIIKGLIYPYYHLWYILGYFSWIIILYILLKINKSKSVHFIFISIFSVLIYIIYFYTNRNSKLLNVFLSDFRLYNLIFFYFGYWLKENIINVSSKKLLLSLLGTLVSSLITFYLKNRILEILLFYVININLIVVSIRYSVTVRQISNNIVCKIGKYSLEIYLLHIIPIFIGKYFINLYNWKFYVVVFLLEILLIITILKIKNIMERYSEKISLYNRIKS